MARATRSARLCATLLLAGALAGCNQIFGIEKLQPAAAGDSAESGGGGNGASEAPNQDPDAGVAGSNAAGSGGRTSAGGAGGTAAGSGNQNTAGTATAGRSSNGGAGAQASGGAGAPASNTGGAGSAGEPSDPPDDIDAGA